MPDPLDGLSIPRTDQSVLGSIAPGEANYSNVDKTVRGAAQIPGLTETILPAIKSLLMPGDNNPYEKLIDRTTQGNVSAAQSDAMKRGITGSDIEAGAMAGARSEGEFAKSNFFAQNATHMADLVTQMATGDLNSQRENLMMYAQLMGQKITSDNDLYMFQQSLQANLDMADKNRKNQLWAAGIGAAGSVGGAAIKKYG